ncbi:serine-arginine protein 55 isoform X2 [Nematostella vectensis]|uniref:serine-arginine protein 55 isoform X2 n=1 Tax=Nematostella vectensis TaxID=45351 RepID=UPI002076D8A2|nr:serine-arginine protein 55 isoform X2 [Nematostella vectensis]
MSRIFLGRLPRDVRESDVEKFLRGYGKIRDISLKRGYGFVEFDDHRDAEDAVHDLNGRDLIGERVVVEFSKGRRSEGGGRDRRDFSGRGGRDGGRRPMWLDNHSSSSNRYGPPVRTNYSVIVENLSSRTSWQDLKDYFRKYGKVTYADAHKKRIGEGVVEFESKDDLNTAIEKLDDTELGGRRIRVYEDKDRDSPPRSSRRRSRSHSRSRSRSPKRRSRSNSRSRSRSRSASPKQRKGSRSKSRSYSHSPRAQSRSRSPTPTERVQEMKVNDESD